MKYIFFCIALLFICNNNLDAMASTVATSDKLKSLMDSVARDLCNAAYDGDLQRLKYYDSVHGVINRVGIEALKLAAWQGRTHIICYLLDEKKLDVNAYYDRYSILEWAVLGYSVRSCCLPAESDAIKALLERGAKVTPLMLDYIIKSPFKKTLMTLCSKTKVIK